MKKTDDGSQQTTKQMLDELDALMDRMLSLPVSDVEEPPPPPEKPAVLSAKLTLLEAPPAPPIAMQPAVPMIEKPIVQLPVNPPHFTLPVPQPAPLTNDVTPPTVMPQVETLLKADAEEQVPLTSQLGYLPLRWINDRFDNAISGVPLLGKMLRTQNGRGLLGFLGIVLSAAAFGWLLKDLLGWN